MKSTFISVISHELKTPVALIKGYASTLQRTDAHWDAATVSESLKVIEDESDRLAELIERSWPEVERIRDEALSSFRELEQRLEELMRPAG